MQQYVMNFTDKWTSSYEEDPKSYPNNEVLNLSLGFLKRKIRRRKKNYKLKNIVHKLEHSPTAKP